MEHLFGPVLSRRLGLSLGVDLLRPKTCNLDCVYCEIGRTLCLTTERGAYVAQEKVIREIRSRAGEDFDYLTFAGSGEPTLSASLGEVLRAARKITDKPLAVITNSILLKEEAVRKEVAEADLILPSLDAATQKTFQIINRPPSGVGIDEVIDGLRRFRREFSGEIWLEVMLVKGINDHEAPLIAEAADSISPDRIQLNTVVRPPAEPVQPLSQQEMLKMLETFPGAEVIPDWDWRVPPETETKILEILSRRPCTVEEIMATLRLNMPDTAKYLSILERRGDITREHHRGKLYFLVT